MNKSARIFVAGNQTVVGNALKEELRQQGYSHLLPEKGHEPDLTDATQVAHFFSTCRPDYVFLAAGKSGGIAANQAYPADFMINNLLIECLLIENARCYGARKLLYLASSCSYPRDCPQPMKPEYLLQGPLEPTNEAYAVAKLAGIKLCQAYRQQYGCHFIVGIPANPFGPLDDFDPQNSHVIAALIRKMHEAKKSGTQTVDIWGTGTPRRDFIFTGDLAKACIFVMNRYDETQPINLGCNSNLSIADLAAMIQSVTGFRGKIVFDHAKPDGMPIKCLDATPLFQLGWRPVWSLEEGLRVTYEWYLSRASRDLSQEATKA